MASTWVAKPVVFRLRVDILGSQGMKQDLLTGNGVLESVEQPTPTEVMVEVFGGDTVKTGHPAFEAAVVSVDVLHMPDAAAATMAVEARDETAHFNAEVRGHEAIAGLAIGAQDGIGA